MEYNNQVVEAAFRKELVYGEDDRVEYAKPPTILELFAGIKFNYHRLFLHYGYFDLWLIMYNQSMIIVPYIIMGPGLFTGAMTLGILIQTSSAFREVQSSFSLFMQNWTRITELRSIYKRLTEFEKSIGYKNPDRSSTDISCPLPMFTGVSSLYLAVAVAIPSAASFTNRKSLVGEPSPHSSMKGESFAFAS